MLKMKICRLIFNITALTARQNRQKTICIY
nr:MAG TPA: hypothetical protein [Caudoviricetes sp.]DAY19512.1 MAG TPA: hypothetical protein [Caudoviricetes sp.]DAY21187.1 MAG TPA: hypothetical protein [Caudoviricetes sp.]